MSTPCSKTRFFGKVDPANIDKIIDRLTTGQVTHDYPISVKEATDMGLPVTMRSPTDHRATQTNITRSPNSPQLL